MSLSLRNSLQLPWGCVTQHKPEAVQSRMGLLGQDWVKSPRKDLNLRETAISAPNATRAYPSYQ